MVKVGISNKTRYWQYYAFTNPPEGYMYGRGFDTPWHILGVNDQFLLHTKYFLPVRKFDLYHTYNSIVVNNKPWVVEVESYLPRYKSMREDRRLFKWAFDKLAAPNCKKIIFTSEYTASMNRDRLIENGVDPEKLAVVYRAVKRASSLAQESDTFNILFVGNGFYRKGGMELLRAMKILKHRDIRLNIISRMEVDRAVFPSDEEKASVMDQIEKDPRISLLGELPHDGVIEKMRNAHLFVGTTWSDPFNNTTLEAMACGTAIIGSNTSSFPEIVEDGKNGFLLDIDNLTRSYIAEMIAEKIERLYSDRALLDDMVDSSVGIAKNKFDIDVRNAKIKSIYGSFS